MNDRDFSSKPADALGSLPVVAFMHKDSGCLFPIHKEAGFLVEHYAALTDHAQATAEIAKRDADIQSLEKQLSDQSIAFNRENATLRAKLAGVDGLVEAAADFLAFHEKPAGFSEPMVMDNKQFGEFLKGLDNDTKSVADRLRAALAAYEAANRLSTDQSQ